ncbi:hypothetical protein JTE90_015360 [Oedothorax gibbosus]|uniref:Calponin-homology (CH) domain-containing protein n=1 Tax=Oedothorax gibbosus TaxID=931172 RepID=A0AAV6U2Y1_9ARAC|nr:hypothetical protein JTE90_015360 [Oedothorax gibbosus]
MLKVSDGFVCPTGTMKNNRPASGKPSGNIIVSRSLPQGLSNVTTRASKPSVATNLRKASSVKARINTCSSSQESLTGIGSTTSVRRKITIVKTPASASNVGQIKSDATPIRMISNLQSHTSTTPARKTTFKRSSTNMRRAMSKDSVDFTAKEREKENVKVSHHRTSGKNSNNCITILQMEKEKVKMEQQISELVKNAEIKKAEIATLKMEINKLKDLKSDDAVVQLKQELEVVQLENQSLKERLVQLGVPLEMTALSDNQKEQILIQRSLSGSFLNLEKEHLNNSSEGGPKSLDTEVSGGGACGVQLPPSSRSLSEWERGSSSSLSEMSVACLQDRIMQMEETHHSTNEELQATLQELTDLQDQLVDLQLEGERMADEKAVLLESLCSQTEKLEECRGQVSQLKQLLFTQEPPLEPTDREAHLLDLLKQAQESHDTLQMQHQELQSALQAAKEDTGAHTDLIILRDRSRLLESTVESVKADKQLIEAQLVESREALSKTHIEVQQLRLQLENEQQKVLELQREREAGAAGGELQELLQETRRDKETVEERALHLQEQLALSQREVERQRDQLQQMQEEIMVTKNNAHKQISDLEYRLQQLTSEKSQLQLELQGMEETSQQLQLKCQRHLEDKRDLKATIGEMQKTLGEKGTQLATAQKDMEDIRKKHVAEVEEWNKFQADLLTTVRVANDFKTEAVQDVERLAIENKNLTEKNASLEAEIAALKANKSYIPTFPRKLHFSSDLNVLSNVEKDLQTASRRQLGSSSKRIERGAANQCSVRNLIESIENATKQVKGQGPSSSCSSSSSSLNSIASESRAGAIVNNTNDIFIKSNDPSKKEAEPPSELGLTKKTSVESGSTNKTGSVSSDKVDGENIRPLQSRPVSILASKLDPMRRNSYGDIAEKKDPLSTLVKGGGSKRNALLKWCQNKTLGYKAIDITNFSSSWNDGLAFCAIMHSYLPHLIPYDELDSKDKKRNFTLAFQAAESVGIPTTLNTNDLITQERPDWQSIMTYVTTIYKHFET